MLKVHFLYGSKPAKQFKTTEKKWFGGLIGGHAGIEVGSNKILHFLPKGKFHYIAKQNPHSKYVYNSHQDFYEVLGGNIQTNKKMIVYIPISKQQKAIFDSLVNAYLSKTPYDYAFIGYRCGSATYDCMAQLGILPQFSNTKTKVSIFYPRLLRKKIVQLAIRNNWKIETQTGSPTRVWEKDKPANQFFNK